MELQTFFDDYGRALSDGNLPGIAACYDVPALVLSDDGAVPIADRGEIEIAFAGATEGYRAQGLVKARPTINRTEQLTPRLVAADVHWDYLDAEGLPQQDDDYRYILHLGADDAPHIRVVLAGATGQPE